MRRNELCFCRVPVHHRSPKHSILPQKHNHSITL